MHSDWERTCLMSMAAKRKRRGLSRAEAIRDIDATLHGFSTRFHISRAVSAAYNDQATII
ncbi:hypothetical protein So717_08320 [Roseobacter cerasinus]|uniref:Uncharacterized protein n=1 Tax=Roseobacter cerasinus TaxID=2602289 RepID=A0A640VLV8_9RHOB|nr:hypothetical protein [Roseobacter cerasinus]GFE49079.1 hypothetical protein So717_08320 [Roseobacter cerasinus]